MPLNGIKYTLLLPCVISLKISIQILHHKEFINLLYIYTTKMMTEEPTCHGLLGSNNRQGLLEPLNLNLRQLILRCGDFCQATYGAVNNDENSKYCCSNHYGKSSFFHKGMFNFVSDYKISSFLYATARVGADKPFFLHSLSRESWDRKSNWIGYIDVTNNEVGEKLDCREFT